MSDLASYAFFCGNGALTMFLTCSDDDEFYDRTHKSSKNTSGVNQAVETADSLLDKKNALTKQIEDKQKLLQEEDKPVEVNEVAEAGDALDAYMSTVSSQLGKIIIILCCLVLIIIVLHLLLMV